MQSDELLPQTSKTVKKLVAHFFSLALYAEMKVSNTCLRVNVSQSRITKSRISDLEGRIWNHNAPKLHEYNIKPGADTHSLATLSAYCESFMTLYSYWIFITMPWHDDSLAAFVLWILSCSLKCNKQQTKSRSVPWIFVCNPRWWTQDGTPKAPPGTPSGVFISSSSTFCSKTGNSSEPWATQDSAIQ